MARKATRCSNCGDVIWFSVSDPVPQEVVCTCGETVLKESGPSGPFENLTDAEVEALE